MAEPAPPAPVELEAEAVPAAAPAVKGPLPFNYVASEDGLSWTKMGYSQTAVAKDWRTPTEKINTVYELPAPDHLFSVGELALMAKQPNDLLNPPPLSKEEKRERSVAGKAEAVRRTKDLSAEARAEDDEQKRAKKWLDDRALNRRRLVVRIGRKAWNYGLSLTTMCVRIHLVLSCSCTCLSSWRCASVRAGRPPSPRACWRT